METQFTWTPQRAIGVGLALAVSIVLMSCDDPNAGSLSDRARASTSERSSKSTPSPPRQPLAVFPDAVSASMVVRGGKSLQFGSRKRALTANQLGRLRGSLRRTPAPEDLSACFVPHHRFDFEDGQGRKVGELYVCFCCLGVQSSPGLVTQEGFILDANFNELARLVAELGSSPNTNCDAADRFEVES